MNCDDFRAAYISGGLGDAGRQHLTECSECREEQPALDGARRLLSDPALWQDPSAQVEEQVVGLISGPASSSEASTKSRRSWRIPIAAVIAGLIVASVGLWTLMRSPAAADWKVPIPGTAEAPSAWGVVEGWNQPSGTRVVLAVEGLAPAPEGSVYEFWFSSDDLHVSAGTFTGPGEVELWVGVSRGAYPRLWVTLEPIDTDENPSGVTVLDTEP